MKRVCAIGDVHGCIESLKLLMEVIVKPTQEDILYFTGDYTDRGDDTPATIDYLIELKEKFPKTRFVLGNHDAMFLGYIKNQLTLEDTYTYIFNGGGTTLSQYNSYLNKDIWDNSLVYEELPENHRNFFESLEPIIIDEEHEAVFVHAGLRPNISLLEQEIGDLTWIRETFIKNPYKWGNYTIVHGHTPMTLWEANRYHKENPSRFNVDNGCIFGYNLSCVDILTGDVNTVKCLDKPYNGE